MTEHVVIACEDAGAATALAPVADVLLRRDDKITWWLGPIAAESLRAHGLAKGAEPILDVRAASSRIDGARVLCEADALLAGTSAWGTRLEARAIIEARKQGCPSLGILDFWANYEARLSFPSTTDLEAVPDKIAVIDSTMRDDLVSAGVGEGKLVVTGSPAFDAVLARVGKWAPASKRVLFLSQPIREIYGSALGYTEDDVLAAIAPIVVELGAELVVRPHPREDVTHLESVVSSLPCGRLDASRDLFDAINDASAVVGMTTMALVHSALIGAPTLSVQLGRRGADPLPTNRIGLTHSVTDVNALRETLATMLNGKASATTAAPPWPLDGGRRVIEALDALIASRRAS